MSQLDNLDNLNLDYTPRAAKKLNKTRWSNRNIEYFFKDTPPVNFRCHWHMYISTTIGVYFQLSRVP